MRAPRLGRNAAIVLGVVAFHVLGIIGLQTGLLQRAVELVIPPEMVVIMMEPPSVAKAPPPAPPAQVTKPVVRPPLPRPAPAPVLAPVPSNDPPPPTAPTVPAAVEAPPAPPAPPSVAAPVQAAAPPSPPATSPSAPASPRIELPSSDAAYLNNPRPAYPAMSLRLREQGTVRLRVLVGVDGTVRKLDVEQSSGFERLDQAALKAVAAWKFVPGRRAGVAEEMAVEVPIPFHITNR